MFFIYLFIFFIFILVVPIFIKNLEPVTTVLKSDFSWDFELRSLPQADFKLFKDNKEIKLNEHINIEKASDTETKFSLKLKNIESTDIGSYKIVATNKHGSAFTQADLTVTGAPFFLRKPNPILSVPEKKPIKAEFEVGGIPIPEITWYIFSKYRI